MPKRILQGVVVSDKNDKTIVVKVERRLTHPVLKKTVRLIQEVPRPRRERTPPRSAISCGSRKRRPISKQKRWK